MYREGGYTKAECTRLGRLHGRKINEEGESTVKENLRNKEVRQSKRKESLLEEKK